MDVAEKEPILQRLQALFTSLESRLMHMGLQTFIFVLIAYNLFNVFRYNLYENTSVSGEIAFYLISTVICVALIPIVKYRDIPQSVAVLLRISVPIFIVLWVIGYIPIVPNNAYTDLIVNAYRYIALLTAFLGFYRPSLFLPILLYTAMAKTFATQFYDIPISYTDYRPVLGALIFLLLGVIVYCVCKAKITRTVKNNNSAITRSISETFAIDKTSYYHPLNILMFTAISVYIASYYYSGLQKVILDHAGLYWVTHNKTNMLVLASVLYKLFPITSLIKSYPWIYPVICTSIPFVNWFTLVSELGALITLCNRRLAQIILLSLDAMHLGIFILTGVFFWKWMLFNLAIVLALQTLPKNKFPLPIFLGSVLFIIFAARSHFFVVDLGWFDTRLVDTVRIDAITKDNKFVRVPSNFFLMNSVTYAQNRVGHNNSDGFGTVNSIEAAKLQNQCVLPNSPIKIDDTEFNHFRKQMVYHQQYILKHVDSAGHFNYDFFPHHIWSDPSAYVAFNELDKRLIKGYRMTLKSFCLDFKGNKLEKHKLRQDSRTLIL